MAPCSKTSESGQHFIKGTTLANLVFHFIKGYNTASVAKLENLVSGPNILLDESSHLTDNMEILADLPECQKQVFLMTSKA